MIDLVDLLYISMRKLKLNLIFKLINEVKFKLLESLKLENLVSELEIA